MTAEYIERYSPDLSKNTSMEMEHLHRYHAVAPFVRGQIVLDAGFGDGYGSEILSRQAERVYAIDLDAQAVMDAQAKYPLANVTFMEGSLMAMPMPDQSVDCIVCFEVIEHLDERQQTAFLQEAARVLRSTGTLVISTPKFPYLNEAIEIHNPFHIKEFTLEEFKAFLLGQFAHCTFFYQSSKEFSVIIDAVPEGEASKGLRICRPFGAKGQYDKNIIIAVCRMDSGNEARFDLNSMVLEYPEEYLLKQEAPKYPYVSSLFFDSGSGLNESECIRRYSHVLARPIRQHFAIPEGKHIVDLRWDPVEQMCEIHNLAVSVTYRDKSHRRLTLAELITNATHTEGNADGTTAVFHVADPMVHIPVSGEIESVDIDAQLAVLTFGAVERVMRELENRYAALAQEKLALETQNRQLHDQHEHHKGQCAREKEEAGKRAEREIRMMQSTLSWKITRPLRFVKRFVVQLTRGH